MNKQKNANLSKNDILLFSTENDADGNEPVRFASPDHVGNRRFKVFLDIYKQKYAMARSRNKDKVLRCIEMTIADTICNRCKPRGRFFVRTNDNSGWKDLGFGRATLDVVRRALLHHQVTSNGDNDIKSRGSSTTSTEIFTGEGTGNYFDNKRRGVDCPDALLDRKRHRNLFHANNSVAEDFGFKHPCHRALPVQYNAIVQRSEISSNDVLCAVDGAGGKHILHRTECAVGNNRLHVMMRLRKDRYLRAVSQEERQCIVSEIVRIIQGDRGETGIGVNPPGRFLVENLKTKLWREMNRENAMEAVTAAMQSGATEDVATLRTAALQSLISRKYKKDSESKIRKEFVDEIQRRFRVKPSKGEKPDKVFRNASA